jgi:tetratricopeptide (TPR) repeat protein
MASDGIRARTVLFICAVFLLLVVVHLWWSAEVEEPPPGEDAEPRLSRIQIVEGDRVVDLQAEPGVEERPDAVLKASVGLLSGGSINERRATAIQLFYMGSDADERARISEASPEVRAAVREALLGGLKDADASVADACARALIEWWRITESDAADQHFREGLAAFHARQFETALAMFEDVEQLDGRAPADLSRMKAEVYLRMEEPSRALAECTGAIQAEPRHFAAHYVRAAAHARAGNRQEAMRSLERALAIYPGFDEAARLRQQLAMQEEAGET